MCGRACARGSGNSPAPVAPGTNQTLHALTRRERSLGTPGWSYLATQTGKHEIGKEAHTNSPWPGRFDFFDFSGSGLGNIDCGLSPYHITSSFLGTEGISIYPSRTGFRQFK